MIVTNLRPSHSKLQERLENLLTQLQDLLAFNKENPEAIFKISPKILLQSHMLKQSGVPGQKTQTYCSSHRLILQSQKGNEVGAAV
jgi:hypothetical protein